MRCPAAPCMALYGAGGTPGSTAPCMALYGPGDTGATALCMVLIGARVPGGKLVPAMSKAAALVLCSRSSGLDVELSGGYAYIRASL